MYVLVQFNYKTFYIISPERLQELASLVPLIFTLELPTTYYVPYCRDGTKRILARGKFYNRYNHWRDLLIQFGSVKPCRGLKRKIVDQSTPVRLGKYQNIFDIGMYTKLFDSFTIYLFWA